MLKLTKTGIGLLTKQYRSVLMKCLLLNFGVLICFSSQSDATYKLMMAGDGSFYITLNDGINNHYDLVYGWGDWMAQTNLINTKTTLSEVRNIQSLNYYYTFRVDERVEVIEFAEELRRNKKEMSSLDFMPIKSSSDLRINLIKAEDPLTFSAKTRDNSLFLREVCHA